MKYRRLFLSLTGLFGLSATLPAAVLFDQNVTPDVIFGDGNANGSFTVSTSTATGYNIELGLRAKLRHNSSGAPENTFNSNGDGSYTFQAGVAPTLTFPTGVWSFEWSINTNFSHDPNDPNAAPLIPLNTYTYVLSLEDNVGANTSTVTFDPVNMLSADHALGDNSTGNGGGIVDTANYASNIGIYNVAQNSWKPHWFMPDYDPNDTGVYTISLTAFDTVPDPNDPQNTTKIAIADVFIDVKVIPEPSQALVGLLCVAGVFLRRRQR